MRLVAARQALVQPILVKYGKHTVNTLEPADKCIRNGRIFARFRGASGDIVLGEPEPSLRCGGREGRVGGTAYSTLDLAGGDRRLCAFLCGALAESRFY